MNSCKKVLVSFKNDVEIDKFLSMHLWFLTNALNILTFLMILIYLTVFLYQVLMYAIVKNNIEVFMATLCLKMDIRIDYKFIGMTDT